MPIIAKQQSDIPRELPNADLHHAICVFVEDVGMQKNKFQPEKPPQHKIILFWELEQKMTDGRPFMVSKKYTLSLHEKATLRHDLEAWRGKGFEPEELEGFDVEKLRGIPCRLSIVHKKNENKTSASISAIMKADPHGPKLVIHNKTAPDWLAKERNGSEGF